jgi:SNF2 family DNA or RNA helicase
VKYHSPLPLYKHQLDAARQMMAQDGRGLLHMEMGVGKSLVAITVAGALAVRDKIDTVWVICPKNALGVWESELKIGLNLPYSLSVQGKDVIDSEGLAINLMTYDTAWRRQPKMHPRTLVIADEIQKIKNHNSKRSRYMGKVGRTVRYRLGLSGTPAPKWPFDYFGIFRFVEPAVFGTKWTEFKYRYGVWANAPRQWLLYHYQYLDELQSKVQDQTYAIQKKDCLDLPKKTRQIIPVHLSEAELELYRQLKTEFIAEFGPNVVLASHVLTRLIRLSEVTGGFTHTVEGDVINVGTSKLDTLCDLVEPLCDSGERVVVYARYRAEIAAIVEAFRGQSNAAGNAIWVDEITGDTSSQERVDRAAAFASSSPGVFVLSLGAASEAINLSCSSYIVFYSIDFDLAHVEQADARNDRPGQTRPMTTYFLLAEGTIDHYMYEAVVNKKKMSDWVGGFLDAT